MKLLISTSARPAIGEQGTHQKILESQKRAALAKKVVKGAAVTFITRSYKAGGAPDKTGTLYKKAGKIKNVVLTASGVIKSIELDIPQTKVGPFTLAAFQKLLSAPLPKAGERGTAIRLGAKATSTNSTQAIKAQIAKHEAAIALLKKKLKVAK